MLYEQLKSAYPQFDTVLCQELESIGQVIHLEEGETLMRTGQYFKNTILVMEGLVKVYREGEEGEEFFLYHLKRGTACALSMICAVKNEASTIKAKVELPVTALAVPLPHMDDLMKNHKSWSYFVLDTYRNRFEELLEVMDQVAFRSLDEKLEFYLKRQFKAAQTSAISITHQIIAEDLNSSREVISRLLKKLEGRKKIRMNRNGLVNVGL